MTAGAGSPPSTLEGGRVVLWSTIDERHQRTGLGWQLLHGRPAPEPAWAVAICEAADREGFLLVSCKGDWVPFARTWYPTLEEARRQVEFEYDGLQSTWQEPPAGSQPR